MNGQRRCSVDIYIHNGILFSHGKEGDPAICNNTDEAWGHYTKLNKPYRERQILQTITCMWNLEKKNQTHKNRKYKSGCHGLGGVGNGERLVRWY